MDDEIGRRQLGGKRCGDIVGNAAEARGRLKVDEPTRLASSEVVQYEQLHGSRSEVAVPMESRLDEVIAEKSSPTCDY
jgi:hypothetical protein